MCRSYIIWIICDIWQSNVSRSRNQKSMDVTRSVNVFSMLSITVPVFHNCANCLPTQPSRSANVGAAYREDFLHVFHFTLFLIIPFSAFSTVLISSSTEFIFRGICSLAFHLTYVRFYVEDVLLSGPPLFFKWGPMWC